MNPFVANAGSTATPTSPDSGLGQYSATPLIRIAAEYCPSPESGLVGVAVDPAFATNGFIYLYRTKPGPRGCNSPEGRVNELVRVTMDQSSAVDPASLTVLLTGIRADTGAHNGGCLRIGPDGKLYVGIGDAGTGDIGGPPGNSSNPYSQDLGELEGKILRLDLDGTAPPDNPYVGQSGKRPEVFASGFRNPWRFGFDRQTGAMWVGDVGEESYEEIDIVARAGNYSWPRCEGSLPEGCMLPGDVAPVFTYRHNTSASLGEAVMGGDFADERFGPYAGDYFFGDLVASRIYRMRTNPARDGLIGPIYSFITDAAGPVDIQFGADGMLYYVAYAGEVRRVRPYWTSENRLPGRRLFLQAGRRKELRIVSGAPVEAVVAVDGPTVVGGSLRLIGSIFDKTYPLPAENWRVTGDALGETGFKYRDPKRTDGPITRVEMPNGGLFRILGRGPGLGVELNGADPSPVKVILTAGTIRFCMSFGGDARLATRRLFIAKNAPEPAECGP